MKRIVNKFKENRCFCETCVKHRLMTVEESKQKKFRDAFNEALGKSLNW